MCWVHASYVADACLSPICRCSNAASPSGHMRRRSFVHDRVSGMSSAGKDVLLKRFVRSFHLRKSHPNHCSRVGLISRSRTRGHLVVHVSIWDARKSTFSHVRSLSFSKSELLRCRAGETEEVLCDLYTWKKRMTAVSWLFGRGIED